MSFFLQLYGLAFILLGLVVLVWPKRESEYGFARILWLLAGFGLTHGLVEWLDLWGEIYGASTLLEGTEAALGLISYLFLFEFGRRLIRSAWGTEAVFVPRRLALSPAIHVATLGIVLSGALSSAQPLRDVAILSQYFIGFPGAMLAGVGLMLCWRRDIKPHLEGAEHNRIEATFYVLMWAFFVFGILDGLVVPVAPWFPASAINEEVFRATLYFPVESGRAACAVLIAGAMLHILRIFDIESRRKLIEAQARSERDRESFRRASEKYELLLRTASDGIHVLDMDGNVVEANEAFCRMLGYTREEVLGMNVSQWDAHFSADELKIRVPQFMDQHNVFETQHRCRDGRIIDVEISTVGVAIDGRTFLYCASRDISDRKHAEEQLRLVGRAFDRAAEGVVITDEHQRILTVNDSFTAVTGYTREEAIGKTPAILQSGRQGPGFYKKMWEDLHNRGWWQGEIWNRRKNGELYLEWLSINAVRDESGKIVNYIGMFSDITLIRESRQRMEFLATHDELTGLPNRTLFNDHLRLALARSARSGTHLALLFVDLDNFKMINDTLGHEEGDELLRQVASRLKACAREADAIARLGGDEFVVLMEIDQRNEAAIMARRMLDAFIDSFVLQGQECFISSSIGISLFPEDATDPRILMRHADTAMYRAKEHGKNTYMFFTADMAEQISRRMQIENALRQAIPNNELCLEYQPQVGLGDGLVMGAEALLRWCRQGEILQPHCFIQIAEESGLVVDIDEWVVGEVCRQIALWDAAGLPPFLVSINLSARHFRRPDLLSRITDIVAAANVSPRRLCLEITEGVLMDAEGASQILQKFHDAGFRVSVDDFGTGFSSLSYLKRLPIDEVKVDRSFVDGVASDPDDRAITTAIIAMARGLGLQTVAEGVETEVQQEVLRRLGCDMGQGFLYSGSLPGPRFTDWLLNRLRH